MRVRVAAMLPLVAIFSVSCTCRQEGAPSQFEEEYRFEEVRIPLQDGPSLFAKVVGHGRDTVIIPAAMYLANDFQPLVHGRTLIFYDMRGRGASDYVGDPSQLGIEFDVADLETIRLHFDVGRLLVCHHSIDSDTRRKTVVLHRHRHSLMDQSLRSFI